LQAVYVRGDDYGAGDLRNALEQAGIEFLFIGEHAAGICKRDPD
jgi:hypothetical protein